MNFSSPLPRGRQSFYSEGSALRSNRDADAVPQQWYKNQGTSQQNDWIVQAFAKMQTDINRLRRRVVPLIQNFENFYPFKVYQPDNAAAFVGQNAILFNNGDGSPTTCTITAANVPTNLAAMPPTVSIADSWRFFAVRCGAIEVRPIYTNLFGGFQDIENLNTYYVSEGNNAVLYGMGGIYLANTGGGGTIKPDGTDGQLYPFDSPVSNTQTLCVLGGSLDPSANAFQFAIWIQLIPDTATFQYFGARVMCYASSNYSELLAPIFPAVAQNALSIPIAFGQFSPPYPASFSGFSLQQYQFNHVYRFPPGNGNFAGNVGTSMNQRGLCQDFSAISADLVYIQPSDLASQLFYPGDVVYAAQAASGDSFNYYGLYQFTGAAPAFPQSYSVPGYTPKLISPWSDANFSIIYIDSGADNLFLG